MRRSHWAPSGKNAPVLHLRQLFDVRAASPSIQFEPHQLAISCSELARDSVIPIRYPEAAGPPSEVDASLVRTLHHCRAKFNITHSLIALDQSTCPIASVLITTMSLLPVSDLVSQLSRSLRSSAQPLSILFRHLQARSSAPTLRFRSRRPSLRGYRFLLLPHWSSVQSGSCLHRLWGSWRCCSLSLVLLVPSPTGRLHSRHTSRDWWRYRRSRGSGSRPSGVTLCLESHRRQRYCTSQVVQLLWPTLFRQCH